MIAYFDFRRIYYPGPYQTLADLAWIYRGIERSGLIGWGTSGIYSRAGCNIMPFLFPGLDLAGVSMPSFDPDFSLSWQEVTDKRCSLLRQQHFDRPWIMAWSGGIDSTVMVAAVLRNLSRSDLSNIVIACNRFSIWENPRFYHEHVLPNFRTIDSSLLKSSWILDDKSLILSGEPADRLFGKQDKFSGAVANDGGWPDRDCRTDPDGLIDWLRGSESRGARDDERDRWVDWFYPAMMENINSQSVPVETYRDFIWWFVFNFTWIDNKIRGARQSPWSQLSDVSGYFQRTIDWFDSDDYQLWSMNNNRYGQKYGRTVSDNKIAAKRYIFDFDREPYYFKFKTKISSIDLMDLTAGPSWSVLFQDFSTGRFSDVDTNDLDRSLMNHLDPTVCLPKG